MEAHRASLAHDSATGNMSSAPVFPKVPPTRFSLACEGERLAWAELVYESRTFVFSKDMAIRVTKEEDGWVFESEDVPELTGFDTEYGDAELAFRQTFAACWERFAGADDGKLNRGAKNMKRVLLELVKSCVHA